MNANRIPLTFTLRHTDSSPALEAEIEQCAARLEKLGTRATRCTVLVEAPAPHHRQGAPWHIRIDVSLPGHEIVVDRESESEVYEALHHAFDLMVKRISNYRARKRTQRRAA